MNRNPIWRPPPPGVYKLNIDASWKAPSPACTLGAVIRDSNCRLVSGLDSRSLAPSPAVAEAQALREGLILAKSLGIDRILVEADCLSLIETCRGIKKIGETRAILEDIKVLKRDFLHCGFTWIPRERNGVAHMVAQLAKQNKLKQNWVMDPPYDLRIALDRDSRCIPPRFQNGIR